MRRHQRQLAGRNLHPQVHYSAPAKASGRRGVLVNQRVRGVQRNQQLPFVPPEDWYEPAENGADYQIIVQDPGEGYRHILTPAEINDRLAELPEHFLDNLEIVQLSRMTRKKQ